MAACIKCTRGRHDLCWGLDGPMTSHPDSLPMCDCPHRQAAQPKEGRKR